MPKPKLKANWKAPTPRPKKDVRLDGDEGEDDDEDDDSEESGMQSVDEWRGNTRSVGNEGMATRGWKSGLNE